MKSRHIEIRRGTDGLDVITDDWEICDYLDDVLVENDLELEHTREEVRERRRFYVMHFATGVTEEQLRAVIARVVPEEVERIWKLNNEG